MKRLINVRILALIIKTNGKQNFLPNDNQSGQKVIKSIKNARNSLAQQKIIRITYSIIKYFRIQSENCDDQLISKPIKRTNYCIRVKRQLSLMVLFQTVLDDSSYICFRNISFIYFGQLVNCHDYLALKTNKNRVDKI